VRGDVGYGSHRDTEETEALRAAQRKDIYLFSLNISGAFKRFSINILGKTRGLSIFPSVKGL